MTRAVRGTVASANRALGLATISFTLSFAAWGLVAGLASVSTGLYGLTASQTTSEFVAFGQKCTHLSCAVIPRPEEGSFYCPCHEGRFDLRTGVPTAGPPRRPLTRVLLELRGRDIYAIGVEERTV